MWNAWAPSQKTFRVVEHTDTARTSLLHHSNTNSQGKIAPGELPIIGKSPPPKGGALLVTNSAVQTGNRITENSLAAYKYC